MDASDRTLPDLVGLLKAWIPWRSEPANVSRDFWMPDQSCRVCYECDSQFTLFNRRHHCRLCGRVFCAKCTSNWVPAPSTDPSNPREEREKVRACNYCFMQWEQALVAAVDNGIQFVDLDSGPYTSATSFTSFKSDGNCDTSSNTSMPHSMAGLSSHQSPMTELSKDREGVVTARGNSDHDAADMGICNYSPTPSAVCTTRSEEEEYDAYQLDSERKHLPQVNDYYGHIQFNDIHEDFGLGEVHMDGEAIDTKSVGSFYVHNCIDSQTSEEVQKFVKKEGEPDISDECEASSSLYAAESVSAEPVDFENNGVIWIPPEPEDEEDEREALLFDDDDDGDAAGEWGNLHASSSFGSGEYRSKDKSNEEHKKVMKNVVDGHFRALIAQLMQVENLPMDEEDERDTWLEIITSLSWEAATLLKPDTSEGGGMDPGGYVKVKCVASGRRSDCSVVKGIVCKKNVAHRRMTSKIEKPRILILGGALEYQRVANALSSFDTLLQQEMDHLKMAVARIDAHQPDVLLVEKTVSRHAQDYLLAKDISVVLNIKRPLLERIARCTGGQIVPSIDHLSSQKLGHCDMFHVDKFVEEHGTAGQSGKKLAKTLMYFEGCPKPLGCTLLLRGANGDELKKVKHVLQYSVFAAYHLALETSFLADEGASLPELPLNSPITVALPDKPSPIDRSISMIPGFTPPGASEKTQGSPPCGPQRSYSVPTENLFKDFATHYTAIGTDCVKSSIASQQGISNPSSNDSFLSYVPVDRSAASSKEEPFGSKNVSDCPRDDLTCNGFRTSDALEVGGVAENVPTCFIVDTNQSVSNSVKEPASSMEEFPPSPSDHQSILVSLSSRCVWKGTVCERSHLFRIKYYGNFDKPLGRFLRDHLFDQSYICRSCEMPSEAHVHCYTHRQGTLTISVKKLPEFLLPGEKEGKIWMWHRCLKCPRMNGFPPATRRVIMSDAAWGLSFGKFLELSFSNHAAASRVASCGHSLHRDCLRFYGFGKMVACFRYASINVLSVYLPPPKLDFNYENQDWIQQEVNEVKNRAELLFSEVQNALSNLEEQKSSVLLNSGVKLPEARHQMADLEEMLQKEKAEFEESLQKILNKEAKKGQPIVDIFEINRLRRQLLFQSYMWDHRLVYAAASLDNQSPDDADISTSDVDKYTDSDIPVDSSKDLFNSNPVSLNEKPNDSCEEEGVSGSNIYQTNAIMEGGDADINSKRVIQNPSSFSFIMNNTDSLESNVVLARAHSDVFPIIENLSDTLDAAWTGESHSDLARVDSLIYRVPEKLDVEDSGEEHSGSKLSQSPLFSSKGVENMEDSMSWLGMPFISFYRSLNKNFLGGSQKLDTLCEYNPVYISSFRESDAQGGARLLLPIGVNDTVIPVYDDEPASLISYALISPDYLLQVSDEVDRPKESADPTFSLQSFDSGNILSLQSMEEIALESWKSLGSDYESFLSSNGSRCVDPLSYMKAIHARVSFADDGSQGKAKYTVTCYYAKRFEALRRICCPSEIDFVRSLSRCKKWGAQGGKSNVFFAKTLDDRFILKQVTKTELESFIKFAPGYFKYLTESVSSGSPTCLAKILGIYQVTSKHLKGGKETKMDVLVMENLLFGRNLARLYDLKGSSRSRYNADSSGSNKVLLDQNLIESMPTCPIFVGNKAKRLLERAVWNDTAFLASIDVMDYSLLVGVDEEKHELVLGIIDFMRQYTWDKHLETWVKASRILGGPKNASPTVISPKQYKKRFRKAMTTYFLMIPDQWWPQTITPGKSQTDVPEENTHNTATSVS
ncbi:PREDICTED: 1-phosphatidylinositol-3-phosphate 5-kinase FAB1B-like isoform X1 [Ipomoea nil]|uniref:1-phosphatidylinositol-3-phosphate 5-kinase FAB1B-like isoform X1 n=1 Tax=Ipomoea nil TaxID=35883 RepID=UPI00090084FA|nr:PREDICTED: 1-phosphatidylinositol-3-phosphate 5-kinase FAB1B-like isoform X1 [Ipomoea nil]